MSQHSMCAGVVVVEETNLWSAAKQVHTLTSTPQTPVKELTYPTAFQCFVVERGRGKGRR